MKVGNRIGDAEAASLVPALEKMPQLTYLEISCARIGLGRGWSVEGFGSLGCFSGVRCATCVREGRRWMQGTTSGLWGWRHWCRRWRRCRG